jgi:hypothetical protein
MTPYDDVVKVTVRSISSMNEHNGATFKRIHVMYRYNTDLYVCMFKYSLHKDV